MVNFLNFLKAQLHREVKNGKDRIKNRKEKLSFRIKNPKNSRSVMIAKILFDLILLTILFLLTTLVVIILSSSIVASLIIIKIQEVIDFQKKKKYVTQTSEDKVKSKSYLAKFAGVAILFLAVALILVYSFHSNVDNISNGNIAKKQQTKVIQTSDLPADIQEGINAINEIHRSIEERAALAKENCYYQKENFRATYVCYVSPHCDFDSLHDVKEQAQKWHNCLLDCGYDYDTAVEIIEREKDKLTY